MRWINTRTSKAIILTALLFLSACGPASDPARAGAGPRQTGTTVESPPTSPGPTLTAPNHEDVRVSLVPEERTSKEFRALLERIRSGFPTLSPAEQQLLAEQGMGILQESGEEALGEFLSSLRTSDAYPIGYNGPMLPAREVKDFTFESDVTFVDTPVNLTVAPFSGVARVKDSALSVDVMPIVAGELLPVVESSGTPGDDPILRQVDESLLETAERVVPALDVPIFYAHPAGSPLGSEMLVFGGVAPYPDQDNRDKTILSSLQVHVALVVVDLDAKKVTLLDYGKAEYDGVDTWEITLSLNGYTHDPADPPSTVVWLTGVAKK